MLLSTKFSVLEFPFLFCSTHVSSHKVLCNLRGLQSHFPQLRRAGFKNGPLFHAHSHWKSFSFMPCEYLSTLAASQVAREGSSTAYIIYKRVRSSSLLWRVMKGRYGMKWQERDITKHHTMWGLKKTSAIQSYKVLKMRKMSPGLMAVLVMPAYFGIQGSCHRFPKLRVMKF